MVLGGGPGGGGGDWFHVNGVDYNEELDQIAFSSRFASEIYIIDHSTTLQRQLVILAEILAWGEIFLYRWGNPLIMECQDLKLFHQLFICAMDN